MKHDFDKMTHRKGWDSKKYNQGIQDDSILPMWIADMDFEVAKPIAEAIIHRAHHEIYGYPYEIPAFAQACANWQKKRHQWDVREEEVVFVNGVIPGEIFAIQAFTQVHDQIMIQTPLYPPLCEAIVDNDRQIVEAPMEISNGCYVIDFVKMEELFQTQEIKLFILCNPHNPTGRVFTKEELEKILALCIQYKVLVFSDEIHADIVFDTNKHIPFASLSEEAKNITITGINPGKSFNVAGVRTAACIIGNKELRDGFLQIRKRTKGMGRTVFGQRVFITCYTECEYYVDQLVPYLQKNKEYMKEFIQSHIPRLQLICSQGTYLAWLDFRNFTEDEETIERALLDVGKLMLNKGSGFGEQGKGFMRLNFAVPRERLKDGMQRLKKACEELEKLQ